MTFWVHGLETPQILVDKQKPTNSDKLQEGIMKEWGAIRQELAQKLIESMPSRIAEVLKKQWANTANTDSLHKCHVIVDKSL